MRSRDCLLSILILLTARMFVNGKPIYLNRSVGICGTGLAPLNPCCPSLSVSVLSTGCIPGLKYPTAIGVWWKTVSESERVFSKRVWRRRSPKKKSNCSQALMGNLDSETSIQCCIFQATWFHLPNSTRWLPNWTGKTRSLGICGTGLQPLNPSCPSPLTSELFGLSSWPAWMNVILHRHNWYSLFRPRTITIKA